MAFLPRDGVLLTNNHANYLYCVFYDVSVETREHVQFCLLLLCAVCYWNSDGRLPRYDD